MNTKVPLSVRFDRNFHGCFLAHMLRDSAFLKKVWRDVDPGFFSDESWRRVVLMIQHFYSNHKAAPGELIYHEIDDSEAKKVFHPDIAKNLRSLVDTLFGYRMGNGGYRLEEFRRFLTYRAVASAMPPFTELIEESKFDAALKLIKEPLSRYHTDDDDVIYLGDVVPEPMRWLWPNRIPRGGLTLIAGDVNQGKSLLTLDLATRISRGLEWPDCPGSAAPKGKFLIAFEEDSGPTTVVPRLIAAGADMSRMLQLRTNRSAGNGAWNLADDIGQIERVLERHPDIQLVVIDPLSEFLGTRTDSYRASDVRALLRPLNAVASRFDVAFVLVSHPNKDQTKTAINRIEGSLAFVAAARSAWMVACHPDDPEQKLFLMLKSNLSPLRTGLSFRTESATVETPTGPTPCPVVAWGDETVTITADEVLQAYQQQAAGGTAATKWLREQLESAPSGIAATFIHERAQEARISRRQLDKAADALGVVKEKQVFADNESRWIWYLPERAPSPIEDWLRGLLEEPKMHSQEVLAAAENVGYTEGRVRAVFKKIGGKYRREGMGSGSKVFWVLPAEVHAHETVGA